ncbi:glycosyltransferase family 2 protein [Candidatus Venteria ishoeyi]|uniref:glycosyltransferase n=1 Tax=Candidatus Venteria ishoeyi TaxID=1899563 RepID=UPI0025A4D258|nr:glycosyltransferase family 2 protein [Candidatus Venteria ishoeyi]MDM8548185.1 glycosyltransferase family 2 protein [Candidatus Venteria ishoeyi]
MPLSCCFIVLNWNGWNHTRLCLESLLPLLDNSRHHLIVCDNASSDDSYGQIQQWLSLQNSQVQSQCVLLATGANLGFAGGMNVGLVYALKHWKMDYFWLLNNDVQVHPQALQQLLDCAQEKPEVGLWGCSVLEAENREMLQCAGGCRYYSWLTVFRANQVGIKLQQAMQAKPQKLDYVYGAAMFFCAEAVKKTGLLNEEYFLFYEELDYSRRLQQNGYQLGWCKNAEVYHQGSASIGRPDSASRARIQTANYYENLSTLKYSRNFHPYQFPIIFFNRFILKALVLAFSGRWFLFSPLLRAYRDFLK